MKDTLITALTGNVAIIGTNVVASQTIPSPDEIQSIGQLIIQAIIGIITVWRVLKDKKKNKDTYKENN
jgi:hypothetical protein